MKLSWKLWIYFIISSISSFLLFVICAVLVGHFTTAGYTHKDFQNLSATIIEALQSSQATNISLEDTFAPFETDHPEIQFNWFSEDGRILYSTSGRQEPYSFSEYSELFVNQPYALWTPGEDVNLIFAAGTEGDGHFLHLHIPTKLMQSPQFHVYVQQFSDLLPTSIPVLIFILMPYLFTFIFFSSLRKRLKRLNRGLSEITLDHQREIDDPSKDEMGQLTRHFNAMSRRIQEQVARNKEQENKRKTLISNLSHDLRTPLTNILGYAETIRKRMYQDEEELHAHTKVILDRSRYMEQLLDTLFEVSQLDKYGVQLQKESCHLQGLLRKICAEYVQLLELKKMETVFSIPDTDTRISLDPRFMERALRNLLDNAIKYGASGKYLGVEYKESEDRVEISVIDHGPGIPEEQLPLLFDRFFQGSQNRDGEGFGIGLSIVKEMAEAHNGDVTVSSTPCMETRFTLTLPR